MPVGIKLKGRKNMEYAILFVLGIAIGSFLNVLICRLEKGESFIFGRSHCPHCGRQIRWYDNIPLLSFLILRGRCRDCNGNISRQYPIVEAATGALFVAIYFLSAPSVISITSSVIPATSSVIPITSSVIPAEAGIQTLINLDSRLYGNDIWIALGYLLIVFSGLFAILIYDFKHYIIPNKIIYPLIIFVSMFYFLGFLNWDLFRNLKLEIRNFQSWQEIILSLLVPLFFLSLIVISRGKWMGMGDVKLALFMALFLGWPNVLVATVTAFWLGTLVSVPLVLVGKKGMQSQVPFGPFLIVGTFIAYFWGEQIISWYLKLAV